MSTTKQTDTERHTSKGLVKMLVLLFALALLFYMNVGHLLQLHAIGSDSPKTTPPATEPKVVNDHDPATKAWSYNFSDYPEGALPSKDWRFETGTAVADYHHELQSYTSSTSNVRIEGGVLVIEARQKNLNGRQFTSGRISTLDNFSFTYGSLEVDMMLPEGTGTWPAAWLMPRDNVYKKEMFGLAQDDKLAWALNGEIDFGEAIGSLPGQNIPAAHSYNELHQAPTYTPAYVPNPYTQYHRYGVIKTPDKITFTLDGKPYATRQKTSDSPLDWPFNQPYYLILNLAIGGDWAGDEGVDISFAPWRLQVKSISYKPL